MIYFDNAASAMPHPDAINFVPKFGNPSSQHMAGKQSAMVISETRKLLANLFGGEADNYYFTSGATESANLFIQGVCRFLKEVGSPRDEIIVSAVEHPAVFNTAHCMIHLGFKVHVLPVDRNGVVNLNSLRELICHKTALVCIMGVNNETGVIQPVNKAFYEVKKYDDDIITLCDSVQLLTKTEMILNLDVVDAFFSSGHKIGATKGIGFLYLNDRIMISPLYSGGEQESGFRPGTENLYGIESLLRALNQYVLLGNEHKQHVKMLKECLLRELKFNDIQFDLNSKNAPTSNYVVSISFPNIDASHLVSFLSQKGVCVSKGSACSSTSVKPSRILIAMSMERKKINSIIRISFSCYNTAKEITTFCGYILEFKNSLVINCNHHGVNL